VHELRDLRDVALHRRRKRREISLTVDAREHVPLWWRQAEKRELRRLDLNEGGDDTRVGDARFDALPDLGAPGGVHEQRFDRHPYVGDCRGHFAGTEPEGAIPPLEHVLDRIFHGGTVRDASPWRLEVMYAVHANDRSVDDETVIEGDLRPSPQQGGVAMQNARLPPQRQQLEDFGEREIAKATFECHECVLGDVGGQNRHARFVVGAVHRRDHGEDHLVVVRVRRHGYPRERCPCA